jgi:hypothetical protein
VTNAASEFFHRFVPQERFFLCDPHPASHWFAAITEPNCPHGRWFVGPQLSDTQKGMDL